MCLFLGLLLGGGLLLGSCLLLGSGLLFGCSLFLGRLFNDSGMCDMTHVSKYEYLQIAKTDTQ